MRSDKLDSSEVSSDKSFGPAMQKRQPWEYGILHDEQLLWLQDHEDVRALDVLLT